MSAPYTPRPTAQALIDRLHLVWDDELHAWRSPVANTSAWEPAAAPFRVLVAFAVDQARPIIEDGAATDGELADLLPVAEEALNLPGTAVMTDAHIDALARVAALGSEYMENCRYAEDEDFPEDAALARVIQGMREEAFTMALTINFQRRWQD